MNAESHVLVEQLSGSVKLITLNRPEKLNAISVDMLLQLQQAITDINLCRNTRVVVITGAGRGFCAGADLSAQSEPGEVPGTDGMGMLGYVYKYQELLAETVKSIHECDKPVIAAVNGAAVGGGLAFSLACDFRIASAKAKFGAVFIKTGLSSCDVGTSYFLPRLIPAAKALELMTTGRIFSAEQADDYGLLNKLVGDDTVQAALELAEEIEDNSEYGVWMTKKGFWQNLDASSLSHAMELENRTQALGYFTGCMEASMEAFVKGEKPVWPKL